jgi:GAF domain-containing protein
MSADTQHPIVANTESNLEETRLILTVSQQLVKSLNFDDVYTALADGLMLIGPDRCAIYVCGDLDPHNVPTTAQLVFSRESPHAAPVADQPARFSIEAYPVLYNLASIKEPLVIKNIAVDERLAAAEQGFLQRLGARSLVLIPLSIRNHIFGLVSIEYQTPQNFNEHTLTLFETICNQATIALQNALQVERTAQALSSTQSLYRAGRLLADTDHPQKAQENALFELLYGLSLDQGVLVLFTPDRQFGQFVAWVKDYELQPIEAPYFSIDPHNPLQQKLIAGQPVASADVAADFLPKNLALPQRAPASLPKSLLQVPIILHGETVGWIGAEAQPEFHHFTDQEIDMARAMADQIAIAIQNQRLLSQTRRRAEQFKAVAEVGQAVSGLIDLDNILTKTVNLIRNQFGFYHVSIFLLNERRTWAIVRASTGEIGKIMVERPHRLAVGSQSIVGYVTGTGKPRIALDVGQDAVHFNNPLLPNTHSEMALPLLHRNQVMGALDVQSELAGAFDQEDIETLQIMANQLSTAIVNAQLFEQTQQRLLEHGQLYNISAKTSATLNLREAANSLVIETAEALDVAQCVLSVLDENETVTLISDHIRSSASLRGLKNKKLNARQTATLSKVLDTGEEVVIHVDDLTSAELVHEIDYLKKHKGSAMAVTPVLLRKRVIGFLEVYDNKPGRRLSQANLAFLDSVALQAANAIQNARLFESAQKSLERTQALYRLSHYLAGATDRKPTFETILAEYLKLLNLDRGSVMLLDKAGLHHEIFARIINGQPAETGQTFSLAQDPIAQQLLENPRPLVITSGTKYPLTGRSPHTSAKARTRLFSPLMVEGKLGGIIAVEATEKNYNFSKSDIALGEAIADQVSLWLENNHLLDETRYRTSLLQAAAKVSGAASSILDETELINASVNLIRDQFDFYYVGLFLTDPAQEWAVLRAGTGEAGRQQIEAGHRLKIGGEGMIGWATANRQARIALDVGEEPVHFQNPYLPNTHSELALPLISRGQVIGALTIQSVERGAFSQDDITVLQTMADQLANAIANARLYENTQRSARREAIIREISGKIRNSVSVDDIMKTTVSELGKVLGASRGGITLNVEQLERE